MRFPATYVIPFALVIVGAPPAHPRPVVTRGVQSPTLLVRVLDDASRQPLANAEVLDVVSGQHRFTNEQGKARLAWPGAGQLRLRVRQIGFGFVERALTRAANALPAADTVTVALKHVAYALPEVVTTETSRCDTSTGGIGADSTSRALSASVLEQLRLSAERYDAFRRAYPFRIRVERQTATLVDGKVKRLEQSRGEADSEEWGDPYLPGRIVERTRFGGISIAFLFLSSLADPVFWKHHCFAARGVESLHGERVVRMDFSPTHDVRSADWEGSAFVDSATSLLRRVEYHLTKLHEDDAPRRLDAYTTFVSPSPLIVVPDSALAMWWHRDVGDNGEWGMPDVVQLVHLQTLKYRKATPPDGSGWPPDSTRAH